MTWRRARGSAATTTSAGWLIVRYRRRAGDTTDAGAAPRAGHHPHREDHAGGQDQAADQPMGHRQRQHGHLPARESRSAENRAQIRADAEQELDGEQDQQGAGSRTRHRVAGAAQPRGDHGNQREHGERSDQVQVDATGVREERAEHDLEIDEQRRGEREAAGGAVQRGGRTRHPLRGDQRDRHDEGEERLRQGAVHHREAVSEQHDPEPADHALGDHRHHRHDPQRSQRARRAATARRPAPA